MRLVCECVSEEEGISEAQKGWFMFRGGRVLGWGTSGHLASDVTAGGVSGLSAWTHARTHLSYQGHVPTNHRLLLAFGSPLLDCLDAPWP